MAKLTMDKAERLIRANVTEAHLFTHALAVSSAMGAMAQHFGEDKAHWQAVGYLHDVDYEKFEEDIRAILSHGYGICSDVEPLTNMEKSLFTVDELTGIVQAASLMRPTGISDLEVKSLKKKYKDKKFAAKCSRDIIERGCAMLNMPIEEVMELVIKGMREHAEELGIGPKA